MLDIKGKGFEPRSEKTIGEERRYHSRNLMIVDRTSQKVRRALLTLGLGLILLGLACMYVASLPMEGTVTYDGPVNGWIVIGKISGRMEWTGPVRIWAEFNATGGTLGNWLTWSFVPEKGISNHSSVLYSVWTYAEPNGSISGERLPRNQVLDIVLGRYWGGPGPNVSAQIHWRVSGMNLGLFVPGIAALIVGIPVAAMGRKKKEKLVSLTDFEKNVKL